MNKYEIHALFAKQAFNDGDFEKCLEHIGASGALRRSLVEYEVEASYKTAKKFCAERKYRDAEDLFKRVLALGSHVPANVRKITEKRLSSIRKRGSLLSPKKCPVCRDDPVVQEAKRLDTDQYRPEVDTIYCIAAYRSGYDPQSANEFSVAIRKGKKHKIVCEGLGMLLGHCLSEHADAGFKEEVDFIVPIPSSADRYSERGYAISEVICNEVSSAICLPVIPSTIRITRDTIDLRYLSRYDRQQELDGAFEVVDQEIFEDMTILLIDDVTTYGTTLKEVSKVIRRTGVANIYAAVLAHTESSWWE